MGRRWNSLNLADFQYTLTSMYNLMACIHTLDKIGLVM